VVAEKNLRITERSCDNRFRSLRVISLLSMQKKLDKDIFNLQFRLVRVRLGTFLMAEAACNPRTVLLDNSRPELLN
jgi:hypothetical protein